MTARTCVWPTSCRAALNNPKPIPRPCGDSPLEHTREAKQERARKRYKSFEIAAKYRKPGKTAPTYDASRLWLRCGCCRENECGAERFNLCNGCKIVAYCSSERQRQHWARHKKECEAVQKGEIPKESATRPRLHGEFRHSSEDGRGRKFLPTKVECPPPLPLACGNRSGSSIWHLMVVDRI